VDFWTNPKIHNTNNDYESQRIFGLIQKSVVRIGDRVAVNFWTTPKIHDTTTIMKASGFLDLPKNPLC
jgi:hypothetical protein